MRRVIQLISLKREAFLFDATPFVIKTILAVMFAYLFGINHPIIQRDMISLLFGLMMTLEPVTLTGIKNGLDQIYATLIGATTAAVLMYVFGINWLTVGLAVGATVYIGLKLNWREISPIAIFTSIYMTQYVQKTVLGEPSVYLTFRLRVLALISGVLIAMLFNLIFSFIAYKKLEYKRMGYLIQLIIEELNLLKEGIVSSNSQTMQQVQHAIPSDFNMLNWTNNLLNDILKEKRFLKKLNHNINVDQTAMLIEIITHLREVNHLIYDTSLNIRIDLENEEKTLIQMISNSLVQLKNIKGHFLKEKRTDIKHTIKKIMDYNECDRIHVNLNQIMNNINIIEQRIYS